MIHSYLVVLLILIKVISLSICQDDVCSIWKVSPAQPTPGTYGTCCLSLTDIFEGKINGTTVSKDNVVLFNHKDNFEFLFLSGDYTVSVKNSENDILSFKHISQVIVRGEPNVTVECLNQFCLVFTDVSTVIIKNIHFRNCGCHYYGYFYSHSTYYVVYHYTIQLLRTETEIDYMTFTNSKILFHVVATPGLRDSAVTIKDTIFERCTHKYGDGSILQFFSEDAFMRINVTLHNLKVMDNNSSFLLPVSDSFTSTLLFITFVGHNHFIHNSDLVIRLKGGRLFFQNAQLDFSNNLAFPRSQQAPVYIKKCRVRFEHSHVMFRNNIGSLSGVIFAEDTEFALLDNTSIQFFNNTGELGGALHLDSKSALVFKAIELNILLNFTNNVALRGGAIFVNDIWTAGVIPALKLHCSAAQVKVIFKDNTALYGAGNHIYGGWLGWVKDENGINSYNVTAMNEILSFENQNQYSSESESDIASNPIRICLCIDGRENCSITNYQLEIYGHAVNISLVAVGQMCTKVTSYVEARLLGMRPQDQTIYNQWFRVRPEIENLHKICSNVTYRIYSDNNKESLRLEAYRNYRDFADIMNPPNNIANTSMTKEVMILFEQLSVQLKFKKCPLGFVLDKTYRSCACNLSRGLILCDFTRYKIHRSEDQWINATNSHLNPVEYPGVIAHQHCPYDYCRRDRESLSISFETPHEQCAFNRAGILCGGCRVNFSRVLGSSKCKECSNFMLFAIIPSGLVTGFILVIVLMTLNLTVSVGTINGLIFYANIIEVQSATFFTENSSNTFLSIFISWLNLNLGIESCFYDGLTSYIETWLQLLFPLYIWLLTGIIIVTSHYFSCVSRISGRNAVQVLATLFLLSYTKMLQLVLTIVSSTKITYPDGYTKTVWLYDSNIEFLNEKHLPLFLSALLFLILVSIPYTLLLASIQWLYKISHYRAMFWIQRLKPLFDAYTGPYRSQHRYWTGLLLIARTILLVIFSINQTNNTSMNLLAIIVISFILLAWFSIAKWVYEGLLNNILEMTFLCNLGITSASVLVDEHKTKIAVYTSTSIAFIMFVCIVMYHTLRRLLRTKHGSALKKKLLQNRILLTEQKDTDKVVLNTQNQQKVTFTVVELKQSLLET